MISVSADDRRDIIGEYIATHFGYIAMSNWCMTPSYSLFEKIRRHNPNRALIAAAVCHATGNVAESWERSDSGLTLTVDNVAERLSISRAFGYEALARGEIPWIQVGRRILLANVGLERMLDG